MSLDPSNYSRDSRSTPFILARYRGTCRNCERTVQATIRTTPNAKQSAEYARCRRCGTITRCSESATANHHGGTDR